MFDAAPMYPEGFYPHFSYQDKCPDFKGRAKYYARTQRPPHIGLISVFQLNTTRYPHDPWSIVSGAAIVLFRSFKTMKVSMIHFPLTCITSVI